LRYYSLLLSITDALATCYEYMLRPECCLIDEHVLYVDERGDKLLLPYLPLKQPVYEQQAQQLLLLAVRWAELVNDLDAEGYHQILYLLSSEKLAISPLRQLLLDLIHVQTKHQLKSMDERAYQSDKRNAANRPALTVVEQDQSTASAMRHNPPSASHEQETANPLDSRQHPSYIAASHQENVRDDPESTLADSHWQGLDD